MVKVDIKELIELKEKGRTYEEISEFYREKGIKISRSTVYNKLKPYYESEGKKVPRVAPKGKPRINVSIEELVKLKEQGKSYAEISEFYKAQEIQISTAVIGKRLNSHYQSEGKEVPRKKKTRKPRINIQIEELVELKEKGMSYAEISQYYKSQEIQISEITVGRRLNAHYESQGKKVPRGAKKGKLRKGKPRINISIEELVKLKEQGKSYEEIAEFYIAQGIQISTATVGNRLKEYYKSQGEKVPRSNSSDINKVTNEELIRLHNKGKNYQQISGYYKRRGLNISSQAISKKIQEHKLEKAKEKREKIDSELKSIILNGESVRVYCQRNKCPEREEEFKERIRRLKIIASKAKKQGETYIEDGDFLELLAILENFTILYPANKYSLHIKPYIVNGMCKNGKIDLIHLRVFDRNKDLMCYILSAFKFKYGEEYDNKVWEKLKKDHEAKIDKYIGRLHSIEERRSRTTHKKSKNAKVPQDDEDQR